MLAGVPVSYTSVMTSPNLSASLLVSWAKRCANPYSVDRGGVKH